MKDEIEKLTMLINKFARRTTFDRDRIQVFLDDDSNTIGITIDGSDWSNYLSYQEAEDQIYNLFKGIELGKQYYLRKINESQDSCK